jgi:hypothetical protein
LQRIKSVGVLSSAKMACVIYGCIGLLIIPFVLIGGLASFARGSNGAGAIGGLAFLGIGIFAPIFYAGMGFVVGAVTALIYNLAAKWMGGIEIELESPLVPTINQIGVIWPSPGPK